jgi:hypothetical protein
MATGAIIFRWGANIPGREQKGLEVFGRSLQQSEEDLKEGRIHSHKEYFNVVGEPGGCQIIEGEMESLMAMLADPDHQKLMSHAQSIVEDFTVTLCQGGSEASIQDGMGRYVEAMQEMGWMSS